MRSSVLLCALVLVACGAPTTQAQPAAPVQVFFGSAEATADTPSGRNKVGFGRYILIGPAAEARTYAEKELKRSADTVIIAADEASARKLFDQAVQQWQQEVTQKLKYKIVPDSCQVSIKPKGVGPIVADKINQLAPWPAEREATKVHVLIVCDTDADKIGASVRLDLANVRRLFEDGFRGRSHLVSIHELSGAKATPEAVIKYYRGLSVGPTEAIVFYYSGHGATDPKRGHALTMKAGTLFRSDLLVEMGKHAPLLTVLLTDCCSELVPGLAGFDPGKLHTAMVMEKAAPKGPDPDTIDCLFRRHRGIVDLTAESRKFAFCDETYGGFFTHNLLTAVRFAPRDLTRGSRRPDDGFVDWRQMFDKVSRGTAYQSTGRLPPANPDEFDKLRLGLEEWRKAQIPRAFSYR